MRSRSTLLACLTTTCLAVGCLVAPAAHAAPNTPNDGLVKKWYTDFLGRAADQGYDASGRGYWVDRLDAKDDPRRLLEAILSSAEYAQRTVDGYYDDHLGRDSDADVGSNYWKSGIRADMEPEWVEQNILASQEYGRRAGKNTIRNWYRVILGRDPRSAEEGYWGGRVNAVGPLNTVREIWYAQEAVERRIRDAYDDLLGRDQVGGGEIDYWYDRAFDTDQGLRIDFALSAEYGPSGSATDPGLGGGNGGGGNGGNGEGSATVEVGDSGTPVTRSSWQAEVTITECTADPTTDGGTDLGIGFTIKNTDTVSHRYTIYIDWIDAEGDVVDQYVADPFVNALVPSRTVAVERGERQSGVGTVTACRITNVEPR